MNRRVFGKVEPPMVLLAVLALQGGCVDVNGGAVELSWAIRQADGRPTNCDDARIATIHLVYAQLGDAGTGAEKFTDFSCDQEEMHGSTRFSIEEGRWAIHIEPKCADGSNADVTVPSPIVRDIVDGRVAQLDALLIVVNASSGVACP